MRNESDVLAIAEKNQWRETPLNKNSAIPAVTPADKEHDCSAGYDPYDHVPAALSR